MDDIRYDLYRVSGRTDTKALLKYVFKDRVFRKLFYYRLYLKSGKVNQYVVRVLNHHLSNKLTIDLPFTAQIGKGFQILHPYAVVINSQALIGDNCTIMKGATIGNSKTGKIGAPTIGDNVYIGLNSSIVGGVKVGNNVLIAANTFVNFDVPDDSVVIGSPGIIHHKEKASKPYLSNSILEIKWSVEK